MHEERVFWGWKGGVKEVSPFLSLSLSLPEFRRDGKCKPFYPRAPPWGKGGSIDLFQGIEKGTTPKREKIRCERDESARGSRSCLSSFSRGVQFFSSSSALFYCISFPDARKPSVGGGWVERDVMLPLSPTPQRTSATLDPSPSK